MKRICLFLALVLIFANVFSQDILLLNTNQSLINLNPSFAGSNGGIRDQISYRNQWPAVPFGNSVTYLNSFDAYFKPLKGGIAFSALLEDQLNGEVKINSYSLSYAQHLSLGGNLKIIPSVQFGYGIGKYNPGLNTYVDNNTGIITTVLPETTQKNYIDLNSGLLISYKNEFYGGITLNHINRPDIGPDAEYKIPMTFNLHLSYNCKISERHQVQLFYRHLQQQNYRFNQVCVNMILFNHYIGGVGFSQGDNVMLNLGYHATYFNVVVSYDVSRSGLAPVSYRSWEVHASFNLRNKDQRKILTSFESW